MALLKQGTGKKEKITITAEKGRLSQEEIERMVQVHHPPSRFIAVCGWCHSLCTGPGLVHVNPTPAHLRWSPQEAEEYAEQDKEVKARIDARNQLETFCYSMKSSMVGRWLLGHLC